VTPALDGIHDAHFELKRDKQSMDREIERMNRVDSAVFAASVDIFQPWLQKFGDALGKRYIDQVAQMFNPDGHWKDILAFTWEHRTFSGRDQIKAAFAATVAGAAPARLRVAAGRALPRLVKRSGREVLEGYFDFDTSAGRGTGFIRLLVDKQLPYNPRIWLLLTTLQELRGFEEKVGDRRPSGDEYATNELGRSWREDREARRGFADRDPEVLVVGAGQAGLTIAARMGQIGIDALVVEKSTRVGDVWRSRYESLTLHNEVMANHFPYLSYPETWPVWLTKDHLASWLEGYAQFLDLNVWTGTEMAGATYEESSRTWSATLRSADGSKRTVRCRHIVLALGASGGLPQVPELAGSDAFAGEIIHSSAFKNGANYKGKRVVVVGTGNSGHDVAQDLVMKGADKVWMLQRGPTCVISLEPGAAMVYRIYREDPSIEDVDLMNAAIPYPILEDTFRFITRKAAELDKDLLDGLKDAGFKTYFGRDGTGFQMKFMRGEGGYYIDVGCSKLIANGTIGVIQADDVTGLVTNGFQRKDGSIIDCDVVILATGFQNMQESIRAVLGDDIADRLGPVWGFDEHFQMRNMWRRTAQPGLWITGGSLLDSRLYSRFLALEIKAELEGILPAKSALPLAIAKANTRSLAPAA
jgi:cation diffusion facilitator CzcD-associated flavoprotein CzcO